jgi:KDO2-lipid IV(A) lauroyltransferase
MLGRVIDGAAVAGSRLPVRVAHALAVVGGHIEWALRPGKRRRLRTNLSSVTGRPMSEVRSLVRREIVNEARRSADLLWAIGRPDEFLDRATIVGREHVETAAGRGTGVVLAGAHLGGWEVAAAIPAAVVPVPTTVVVADDWLAWAIQHVRRAAGLRIAYSTAAPINLVRLLQCGEALLVLGDDATRAGSRTYPVRFGASIAELPTGVATLARLAGSPIVPFSVLPARPRHWVITIEPPIEPAPIHAGRDGDHAVLQQLADRWTAVIERHPAEWAASFAIDWRDS